MVDFSVYLSLFTVAMLAASILPLQSEAVLTGLLLTGHQPVSSLLIAASLGNIAGAIFNWYLGRFILKFQQKRWFPIKASQLEKATDWYQKYGKWSLLLSWAPVIGDPLTVVAGVLREKLLVFIVLVSIAKVSRYLVLAWLVLKF